MEEIDLKKWVVDLSYNVFMWLSIAGPLIKSLTFPSQTPLAVLGINNYRPKIKQQTFH